jgi:hypothetical protein
MYNVLITKKRKEDSGYPIVVHNDSLDGYTRGDHFIIKLNIPEKEAQEISTQIWGGILDLHESTFIGMKEIVDKLFFGDK